MPICVTKDLDHGFGKDQLKMEAKSGLIILSEYISVVSVALVGDKIVIHVHFLRFQCGLGNGRALDIVEGLLLVPTIYWARLITL